MDHTTEAGAAIVVEAETERITSLRGTFWVVRPLGGGQAIFDGKDYYAHCGILNIIDGKLGRPWYAVVKD